jgi:hypothetical protein
LYVSLDRLDELELTLEAVSRFVEEMPFIRFAFTEDEVRAARVR